MSKSDQPHPYKFDNTKIIKPSGKPETATKPDNGEKKGFRVPAPPPPKSPKPAPKKTK